jgi:hypothetical protein
MLLILIIKVVGNIMQEIAKAINNNNAFSPPSICVDSQWILVLPRHLGRLIFPWPFPVVFHIEPFSFHTP